MKKMPKRCLGHHAVIISAFICFFILSKHFTSIPNIFFIIYNAFILVLSAAGEYCDFNTNIFKLRLTLPNISRQVLFGLGLATLLSLLFVSIAALFEDISLFPQLQATLTVQDVVFFVFLQIVVALAEEAFFNFYLYDTLVQLFRGSVALSTMIAATLFSCAHWVLNSSMKQAVVAFIFRVAALFIREKLYEDNAFYICSSTHFFYNLMAFFVFSI